MGYSWLTNISIELIVNILSFIYISSKLDILNHLIGLLIYIFSLNIFYVLLLFFFFFFFFFLDYLLLIIKLTYIILVRSMQLFAVFNIKIFLQEDDSLL
jgi:hypothetical protein